MNESPAPTDFQRMVAAMIDRGNLRVEYGHPEVTAQLVRSNAEFEGQTLGTFVIKGHPVGTPLFDLIVHLERAYGWAEFREVAEQLLIIGARNAEAILKIVPAD